jgi:hypothetical protein
VATKSNIWQHIPKFGNKFRKWLRNGLPLAIFCQWQASAHVHIKICGFCTEWHQFCRKLPLVSRWIIFAKSLPNPMARTSSSGSPLPIGNSDWPDCSTAKLLSSHGAQDITKVMGY